MALWAAATPSGPDKSVQTVPPQPGIPITSQPGIWGGPAYYRNVNQQYLLYCGSGGHLQAYAFSGSALVLAAIGPNPNQSPQAFPGKGVLRGAAAAAAAALA
jgi:hypothetical protein